jgi:Family of unknown function (DUF6350)
VAAPWAAGRLPVLRVVTTPARLKISSAAARDREPPGGPARPLVVTGAMAACAVTVTGLVALTPLVLAGWIAAPHAGIGLPGVLRTATVLWLAAHHVGFSLHGAGRIGMLPLGLVLVPGALLWRAGRWVVQAGQVTRLNEVGYAALVLAAPYAALCGALALASRSALAVPSLSQAVVAGFGLALCAGGLGGARALAPWGKLARLLPPRPRSVVLGTCAALAVLVTGGAVLAGGSLAAHLAEFRALDAALSPGLVGGGLLILAQLAYLPNAVGWAICYSLGPGFAFGTGTVVAATGSALGPLPQFPMLAALPAGASAVPGWVTVIVLVLPYLAGAFGGVLLVRAAPVPSAELAPLWGFACGAATGVVIAVLAAFSGGPLGSGRLAAVGPSAWQAGVISVLEVGVAAAIAAGLANWRRLRRDPALAARAAAVGASPAGRRRAPAGAGDDGHRIFLDPWASAGDEVPPDHPPAGPSALP